MVPLSLGGANFHPLRRAVHGNGGSKPLVHAGPENPQVPVLGARCWGALMQPPSLPRMKNKSTKTRSAWGGEEADLLKEKGPEPFPPWAFIRFIRIGMQIKLINHCQPVRVKQYSIYREL